MLNFHVWGWFPSGGSDHDHKWARSVPDLRELKRTSFVMNDKNMRSTENL